jgi:hypothetical protein
LVPERQSEISIMRGLAFGVIASVGFTMAVTASADPVRIIVPGVAVEIIAPPHQFRDRLGDKDRDVEIRRTEGFDRSEGFERCQMKIIRNGPDGTVERTRRCE